MSNDAITDWSPDPVANIDVNGININEGCNAGNINNAIRAVMAQIAAALGTAANYLAGTSGKLLMADKVWSAATEVVLTDAATVATDLNTFLNARVTLAGNRTLGAPTNPKVGQAGCIRLVQDATGSRTLAFHSDWKFAGGLAPVLSTGANKADLLFYQVVAANFIYATVVKAVA